MSYLGSNRFENFKVIGAARLNFRMGFLSYLCNKIVDVDIDGYELVRSFNFL
jgi:hypothetical protein